MHYKKGNFKSLKGQRFGFWTVLHESPLRANGVTRWNCVCDCGTKRFVTVRGLQIGRSKSCGCGLVPKSSKKFENLIGRRFGRLLVISVAPKQAKSARRYWNCVCDCGKETINSSSGLKNGGSTSCGCFRIDSNREKNRKAQGQSGFNTLLSRYRFRAKERGLEFLLEEEDFRKLVSSRCYYCFALPSQESFSHNYRNEKALSYSLYLYNGIDRIDNTKGYIEGNVVSACGQCNHAKFDHTQQEFFEWIDRVKIHQSSIKKGENN